MEMIEAPLGVAWHSNDPRLSTDPRRQDEADDLTTAADMAVTDIEAAAALVRCGRLAEARQALIDSACGLMSSLQ
ncbi:hypothetical protein [Microvirgula aerodenitrificans]|uniref:hypothetical protein n=1 Tax=Microvirgula aerodenitrificans TaxID=57480 RepID=UPI0005637227|nr:hypothetical protein [Microvirgula aerodenitrificans]